MTNIRPLAHGHVTGVVVVSARPQPAAGLAVADDLPIFFLAWRGTACSSRPHVHLPDAIEALLALERLATADAKAQGANDKAVTTPDKNVPSSLEALWETIPAVDWESTAEAEQPPAAVRAHLTRVLTKVRWAVVFTDEDLQLLARSDLPPETIEVTARDISFTLVEAIEAAATAQPRGEPYSL